MKRLVVGLFLIAGTMLGCAQNHFNIPAEHFAEKVKVLGVAPIFVDTGSDIIYPQRELLIPLIAELNRKYEPLLVRKLQGTGNFFAVTLLADEPQQLFSSIMGRRERRDDAGIQYNKYFWKNDEISAYAKKNRLDAMMVVVVSGLAKTSTIYSSNLLTSLETNFDFLTMTAQIVAPDGTVLWEYPNFRGRLLPYYPLVNLQYPDFSESEANLSRKTEVRFKSLDGIRRTLEQKKSDLLFRETQEPDVYGRLFDEMVSLIKHSVKAAGAATPGEKPAPSGAAPQKSNTAVDKRVPAESSPPAPTPAAAPAAAAPVQSVAPKSSVEHPAASTTAPNEIVPAAGNEL